MPLCSQQYELDRKQPTATVYHSDRQALFTARFRRAGPSAADDTCIYNDEPELSMGWIDPWVGLGWVFVSFCVGWVGSTIAKVLTI